MKNPQKLPRRLYRFFWDVDAQKLNPSKYPKFVINRLLDKGDIEAARWVNNNFSEDQVTQTLESMRGFSLKSASFWGLIYNVPLSRIKCFQEPYRTVRKTLWPY